MSSGHLVRVPATTANLGPGFDALGLALAVYNTVEYHPASQTEVVIEGEGARHLPSTGSNVIVRAIHRTLARAGIHDPPAVRLVCRNAVPTSRGMGSSAAAVVAGILVAQHILTSREIPVQDDITRLAVATSIEGHPDNAAPALFGGLQSCAVGAAGDVACVRVPVPEFPKVVLFIPNMPMPTREARAVVPGSLSRAQAVFNISRSALLVAALCAKQWQHLRIATEDALHQKPREAIFPAMGRLLHAALEAGALGAWLSGAGSTLAAFAHTDSARTVEQGFARSAAEANVQGRTMIVDVDTSGATSEPV